MKHNRESLIEALDLLLPNIKLAKAQGITFNIPDLLSMVANQHFTNSFDRKWNPSYDQRCAYYICQEALIDLEGTGYMEFGEKCWSDR